MDCSSLFAFNSLFSKLAPCLWLTDTSVHTYACVRVRVRVFVVRVRVTHHSNLWSYAVVSRALERAPVNHTYNAKCVYFSVHIRHRSVLYLTPLFKLI